MRSEAFALEPDADKRPSEAARQEFEGRPAQLAGINTGRSDGDNTDDREDSERPANVDRDMAHEVELRAARRSQNVVLNCDQDYAHVYTESAPDALTWNDTDSGSLGHRIDLLLSSQHSLEGGPSCGSGETTTRTWRGPD